MSRALAALAAAVVGFAPGASSQEGAKAGVQMDEGARKSVAKALEWLSSQQNSDGSWGDGRYPHNTAVTAFSLLAYLSQGHLPGQGLYGPEVAKGGRFLIASQRSDGYIVGSRGGNMYCHGMATLARRPSAERLVTCAVDQRNAPAKRLYAGAGFREFTTRVALVRRMA